MKVKVDLKNKSDVAKVVYFEYFRSQRCLGNYYPSYADDLKPETH